jgi:hypothetical protein
MHYICYHHCIHTVTLLHVSALKRPSSRTTDPLCQQSQQNTCPDVNIWQSKPHRHQCTDTKTMKSTRYSKAPFIDLCFILNSTPVVNVIYLSDAIWLRCAVCGRCPTISSTSVRHSRRIRCFLVCPKLKCVCGLNAYFKLHQGVNHSMTHALSFLTEDTL